LSALLMVLPPHATATVATVGASQSNAPLYPRGSVVIIASSFTTEPTPRREERASTPRIPDGVPSSIHRYRGRKNWFTRPGDRALRYDVRVSCPAENTLLAYLEDRLDDAARSDLARHVKSCPDCSRVLQEVSADGVPHPTDPLARYVVQREVGAGAMGIVYEALDTLLQRKVALKFLSPAHAPEGGDRELYARLLREAKALARLADPNVVAVYDVGHADGRLFLAMEYVEGRTLAEWQADGPRSWQETLDVYVQAGCGLAAAHEAGLVHRDFKPGNVLVGIDGRVCVTDFGLARIDPAPHAAGQALAPPPDDLVDGSLTRTGTVLGSPAFMAPEQLAGLAADARSDVFSFCVALHAGLYGERPFAGATPRELHASILAGRIRPAPEGAAAPAWLRAVVLRGLAPSPDDRWPSMRALLQELERERALERLARAETVLQQAQAFFHPEDSGKAISKIAVTMLGDALARDAGVPTTELATALGKPGLDRIEIWGGYLEGSLDGPLAPFRHLLSETIAREGFQPGPDGVVRFDPARWYPLRLWVRVSHRWSVFGPRAAFDVGKTMGASSVAMLAAPDLTLAAALETTTGWLRNVHRVAGASAEEQEQVLRRAMGSPRVTSQGDRVLEVVSTSVYPCDSEVGFFSGIAERLQPGSSVAHGDGPCRKTGGEGCAYVIRW
jgi:serine/threonine protein kinase